MHFAPQVIPGSGALIYGVYGGDSTGPYQRVMVQADSASAARILVDGAMFAEAIGDGRLLYQKDGDLFLAKSAPDRQPSRSGKPIPPPRGP